MAGPLGEYFSLKGLNCLIMKLPGPAGRSASPLASAGWCHSNRQLTQPDRSLTVLPVSSDK